MASKKKNASPTKGQVKSELLAFWDADTPLTLTELTRAYDNGNNLDDVGITSDEAESYVNKYNSIVIRAPGKGPLVKPSEAQDWSSSKKMSEIVDEVHSRAQP